MKQGYNSYVEHINGRLHKTIKNKDVGPFDECKILKFVSQLGPEFPQHVECEGVYKLSYDYIEGITIEDYIKLCKITYDDQICIFKQLLTINMKLIKLGIELCDQVLSNFIVDNNSLIHPIDFGYVHNHNINFDLNFTDEYYECLDQAVYTWYRNGLINEDLLNLYYDAPDVIELINHL